MNAPRTPPGLRRASAWIFVLIALLLTLFLYAIRAGLDWQSLLRPGGIRLFFDGHDLTVYLRSSNWVVGSGRLYQEVFSEYPLLANLVFGLVRGVSEALRSGRNGFYVVWMAFALMAYITGVYQVHRHAPKENIWIWLALGPLYFSLFRFDIYPALTTLLALCAIRGRRHLEGTIWLGITAAFKGYALFLLPAYVVFLSHDVVR